MPTVDQNRLKGNFAEACVCARLSSECLVRPVAAGTDVGVDLYCETVEEGSPFLHFWVQVKAGAQCVLTADRSSGSCSFSVGHLEYWYRQPVPVFAALVPVNWPVTEEPDVYIIDITSQLLSGVPGGPASVNLRSDYIWKARERDDVRRFLLDAVPAATARLQCRNGLVASIPTLRPKYERSSPAVPITRFKSRILEQIRRSAALSILFLQSADQMVDEHADFRRTLQAVVEQFGDDPHWENFMSIALSHHADKHYNIAVEFYEKAIQCIENDSMVSHLNEWKSRIAEIEKLRDDASRGV
jgi:hypothetical protein